MCVCVCVCVCACVCVCVCVCMCVCVCLSSLVCMAGVIFEYFDTVYWFYGYSFFICLTGCFSMITWTPTVLSVLYACVLSAQLSMFHMERRSRNTLIIIIIISILSFHCLSVLPAHSPVLCP